MQIIPLQQLPNQSFTLNIEGDIYVISLQTTNGVLVASITRNSVPIIKGTRALPYTALLPYRYEESGNFMFQTSNFQLPQYARFNVTQSLVYYSAAELEIFRQGDLMFNPIAALPLRYKPQGYVQA